MSRFFVMRMALIKGYLGLQAWKNMHNKSVTFCKTQSVMPSLIEALPHDVASSTLKLINVSKVNADVVGSLFKLYTEVVLFVVISDKCCVLLMNEMK